MSMDRLGVKYDIKTRIKKQLNEMSKRCVCSHQSK